MAQRQAKTVKWMAASCIALSMSLAPAAFAFAATGPAHHDGRGDNRSREWTKQWRKREEQLQDRLLHEERTFDKRLAHFDHKLQKSVSKIDGRLGFAAGDHGKNDHRRARHNYGQGPANQGQVNQGEAGDSRSQKELALIIREMQSSIDFYNPIITQEEQKLTAEIQATQSMGGSAGGAATTVNSSTDLSLEQQIAADLTKMQAATSETDLLSLAQQVQALSLQLQQQVTQEASGSGGIPGLGGGPAGQGGPAGPGAPGLGGPAQPGGIEQLLQWLFGLIGNGPGGQLPPGPNNPTPVGMNNPPGVAPGPAGPPPVGIGPVGLGNHISLSDLIAAVDRAEAHYTDVYDVVSADVQAYQSGDTYVSANRFGRLIADLRNYEHVSAHVLRGFERADLTLAYIMEESGQGPTSTQPVTTTGEVYAALSTVSLSTRTLQAGSDLTVSGTLENQSGQPLADQTVDVSFDGQSGEGTSDSGGAWTVTLTPTAEAVNSPVDVTADGVTISTSADVATVNPGAAAKIASSQTDVLAVGPDQVHQVTYTVEDQYGNPIAYVPLDVTLQTVVVNDEGASGVTEEPGTLSVPSPSETDALGQLTVTYTTTSTADEDANVENVIQVTDPGTSLSNNQAGFSF
jgi:hypothetical protein